MTNQDVCTLALRMTGECFPATANDYLSRSPALLVGVISSCINAENAYRAAKGISPIEWSAPANVVLGERFPLSDPLITPAAYELASLLTINEDAEISQTLHKRFEETLHQLLFASAPIEQAYPNLLQ